MYRLINLIGHTWHPYFSEQRGWPNVYVFSKKLQSKITKQNHLQPVQFWGRRRVEKIVPLPIETLESLDSKAEGYQARPWHNIEVEPAILVRIPPFSLVSPGCCTLSECVRLRGYTRWRGPRSSHHFAFSKILSTIYVYGDGNTTCVHTRNFIKKGVSQVLHWFFGQEKLSST